MLKTTSNIKIRYNRFEKNPRFVSVKIKKINFEKGLVSKDLPDLYFINKAKDENESAYNTILDMYMSYLENDYSFMDNFSFDELLPDYKTERLLEILKYVQKTKYSINDLKSIFKLNNKENKELHFFVKKSRDNISILLIDLYHLGIYGERIINGKVNPISLKSIYKSKCKNQCELEKIRYLSN